MVGTSPRVCSRTLAGSRYSASLPLLVFVALLRCYQIVSGSEQQRPELNRLRRCPSAMRHDCDAIRDRRRGGYCAEHQDRTELSRHLPAISRECRNLGRCCTETATTTPTSNRRH